MPSSISALGFFFSTVVHFSGATSSLLSMIVDSLLPSLTCVSLIFELFDMLAVVLALCYYCRVCFYLRLMGSTAPPHQIDVWRLEFSLPSGDQLLSYHAWFENHKIKE